MKLRGNTVQGYAGDITERDQGLIAQLARAYPERSQAVKVWTQVGGRAGSVPFVEQATDLWRLLLRYARNGAVSEEDLLRVAGV